MSINFRIENSIATIEFDQPDSKVNLLSSEVMKTLDGILEEVRNKSELKALVITSAKKDVFIAGADIKEINGIRQIQEGEEKSKSGQNILNKLEDLQIPTIAVINGVALGGGCELALACRYRVATFNEKVKIGLPEVNLGIIPGFAGTYRLPRLIGLTQALKMILAGKVISGTEAFKIGLIDRLFPQVGWRDHLNKFIEETKTFGGDNFRRNRKRKKDFITFLLEETKIGQTILFYQSRKNVFKITKGFYPAPIKALDVISKTRGLTRPQALQMEATAFAQLVVTNICKNLVRVFTLSENHRKFLPAGTESIKVKPIQKCAIIGAGIMGGGIAQLLSSKGISTRLKDINYETIAKGLQAARKIYEDGVKKKKLKPFEVENKMAHITGTLDHSGFKNCDFVIEAVVENMEVKKKVFQELSAAVSPETILCTNTSALSVTEMAKQTKDPRKVVGFHFFNPVHRMPLVEIIKTTFTSPETLAAAFGLARRLDKTPVLVKDSCGFLVNRILLGYINEAGRILEEGIPIEVIDKIMSDFGMPMGPFTLSDEVGLDVGVKVLHALENSFGERFKPTEIFEKIYARGFLGKKAQKGFYVYKDQEKIPNPEIVKMLGEIRREDPNKKLDTDEYLRRMLYLMINEAARCLDDHVVDTPETVDMAMILGTGFPAFRGGLFNYARSVGIDKIINDLIQFQEKFHSDRFRPNLYLWYLK